MPEAHEFELVAFEQEMYLLRATYRHYGKLLNSHVSHCQFVTLKPFLNARIHALRAYCIRGG